jgi:hypothetical protein
MVRAVSVVTSGLFVFTSLCVERWRDVVVRVVDGGREKETTCGVHVAVIRRAAVVIRERLVWRVFMVILLF